MRDAPRGVPCDTILETVSLDAGATYADLRTKLQGSAPEGTTLFASQRRAVRPARPRTNKNRGNRRSLARAQFRRTGDDYDNTRKYA